VALSKEVSRSTHLAGFHYRFFDPRTEQDMGRKVGQTVAGKYSKAAEVADAR